MSLRSKNLPPRRHNCLIRLATPAGFEPATSRLEGECSIQLSYGVEASIGAALSHREARAAIASELEARSLEADAVVAEIVGVAFHLLPALMRLDDRVLQAVLVGEGDRFVERIEAQLNLVQRVSGARPAHQRVGVAPRRWLEFQEPFAALAPARPHRRLGRVGDACQRHETIFLILWPPARFAAAVAVVGARGFEPPTSCSQSRRSTRLSHAPDQRRRGVYLDS